MGHLCLFLAAVAACLLWSATFTACAARTERDWLRRLLAVAAVLGPAVACLPAVAGTALLAFGPRPLATNWFGPTLTAWIAALIGGAWIAWAGLSRGRGAAMPAAAAWPLVGLAALFVLAKAVTFGTLLILDNAVAAQSPYLRLEAAQLMQANLPPAVADADNAATLYQQMLPLIDGEPAFTDEASPLVDRTIDVAGPQVAETLARLRTTLDVVRRAADREACRFHRDWTRPSISMLLPELQSLRVAARLLALAARREAADGNVPDALRDVVRIQRMGRHAAAEPILISALVGIAIDRMALDTLAEVLPHLRKADLPALDAEPLRDLVATVPALARSFYGEEAFGLATFADLADGRMAPAVLGDAMGQTRSAFWFSPLGPALVTLWRTFLLPADVAGYREIMHRYQAEATAARPYSQAATVCQDLERSLRDRSPGILSGLLVPAVGGVFRSQAQAESAHRAAAVLVAATRRRLETGELPASLDALVPVPLAAAPVDPFASGRPLVMTRGDDAIVVYSVGPDGEDDGGPPRPGAGRADGNDDVGLWLAL